MKRKSRFASFLFLTLFSLTGSWAFFFEPSNTHIKERDLVISDWPAECNDLRIAVIADLHIGSPFQTLDSLKALVKRVNRSEPDIILLPGDFVVQGVLGGKFIPPEPIAAELAGLSANAGVFAVLGNHDWWLGEKRMLDAFQAAGITLLEDTSTMIKQEDCQLRLVGITDFDEGPSDIEKAFSSVQESDYVIAMTHSPDLFPDLPATVRLTVVGHTHGGQVYLPGIGRPVVPSRYGSRYAVGHIIEKNKHLYVSPGIGTSMLPVRFLVPPEVPILNLRASTDNASSDQ